MYSKNTDTAKNMLLVLFILLFSSDVFGGYLAMITFYIAYTEKTTDRISFKEKCFRVHTC